MIDTPTADAYPIRLEIPYPERLNRFLPLVKWLLAIPHLIILAIAQYVWYLTVPITILIILFTRGYPDWLFTFHSGMRRWNVNTYSYVFLLRDEYPPFSWETGQYPAKFEVDRPRDLNRFLPLVKWILAIPHFILVALAGIVAIVLWLMMIFVILITGRYPKGVYDFVTGYLRWTERAYGYAIFMFTDKYPPFSLFGDEE